MLVKRTPKIYAAVYASACQPIAVDVVDCKLNPIRVIIGGVCETNQACLYLGKREAASLCDKLCAALQDLDRSTVDLGASTSDGPDSGVDLGRANP